MNKQQDNTPFISGERVYLREVRLEDVNREYYRWMNDPEVTRYLESRFYPNSMVALQDYVKNIDKDRNNIFWAICLKEHDRHIGNIKLGPINWIHRFADVGLLIGAKDCWRQGYASEVIGCLVYYAFDVLNLHKLTAGCYAAHQASLKAFLKNGFQIEGTRRKQYICNGIYADAVMLGLINSEKAKDEK